MVKDTIKKSGIDGVNSKSSSKKTTNMDYGKKQTTNYVSVKTTVPNQTTKKSNTENISGKIGSFVAADSKKSTINYPTSSLINYDKKYTRNSFGEKGGSSGSHGLPTVVPQAKSLADKKNLSSSYMDPKSKKSSITFGIIWLPTKKRNKLKDNLRNSDTRDQSKERTPSMYNFMPEGSSGQIETNKDQVLFCSGTLKMSAPVQIGCKTGGVMALGHNDVDNDVKCTDHSNEDEDEKAGVSYEVNANGCEEDVVIEEANANKAQRKGEDVVDKGNFCQRSSSQEETVEKEECIVVWLHYILKCSDCSIM